MNEDRKLAESRVDVCSVELVALKEKNFMISIISPSNISDKGIDPIQDMNNSRVWEGSPRTITSAEHCMLWKVGSGLLRWCSWSFAVNILATIVIPVVVVIFDARIHPLHLGRTVKDLFLLAIDVVTMHPDPDMMCCTVGLLRRISPVIGRT